MTTDTSVESKQEDQKNIHINLEDSVDIALIESLYDKLEDALKTSSDKVILNAEKIDYIDTASMQLLSSFCCAATTQGIVVIWQQPSEVTINAAKLLGLSKVLLMNK